MIEVKKKIKQLEAELKLMVAREEYEKAAILRDQIKNLKSTK